VHFLALALRRFFLAACVPVLFALCVLPGAQPLIAAPGSAQKQSARHDAAAVSRQGSKIALGVAAAGTQAAAQATDVYAQDAYTEKELVRFIESMPHFLAWARAGKATAYPVVNAAGQPDFAYTQEAAAKARELGWEPRRFFCILGRSAAALYIVEEGADLTQALPPDMPAVTDAEIALVRKHLASLLRAGSGAPAPSLSR
jgi:hypothetical protein